MIPAQVAFVVLVGQGTKFRIKMSPKKKRSQYLNMRIYLYQSYIYYKSVSCVTMQFTTIQKISRHLLSRKKTQHRGIAFLLSYPYTNVYHRTVR